MPLPESEKTIADVLDFITEGSKEMMMVKNEEGKDQNQLVLNTKKIYYKSQIVNSPTFSRFVLELEDFLLMAEDCYNHMSKPRAKVMAEQIRAYAASFGFSIDAKSSETVLDKNNTQGNLVFGILRNKVERKYTIEEDVKKGMWQGMFGKNKNKEEAND